MPSYSDAVRDKAIRYVCEGRVRPEVTGGPIESWLAFSDDDEHRYRVVVGPGWSMCTCPASAQCAHRLGGELLSILRREDSIRYTEVISRVLDRVARDANPIAESELWPTGKGERPQESYS